MITRNQSYDRSLAMSEPEEDRIAVWAEEDRIAEWVGGALFALVGLAVFIGAAYGFFRLVIG